MMRKLSFFILLISSLFLFGGFTQDDAYAKIYGEWWSPENRSKIKFYRAKNDKFYGRLVWMKDPLEEDGTPKKDLKNPDAKLREMKLEGLVLFRDFEYVGKLKWENGKVYDPESGKTYDCSIKLSNDDTMEIRGYIGISLLGRTETFKRVK